METTQKERKKERKKEKENKIRTNIGQHYCFFLEL
jgi:hypothetical protein